MLRIIVLRMFRALPVFILGMVLGMGVHAADEETLAEAEKLLDNMDMQSALEQSIDQMLTLQVQSNPGLTPFRGILQDFLNKHMSYESLKPDMIRIYAEAFTAAELKDINAFYSTPTGQKTITLIPVLMAQGSELGAQRVQENLPELQQKIQEETLRLQAEQAGQSDETPE